LQANVNDSFDMKTKPRLNKPEISFLGK